MRKLALFVFAAACVFVGLGVAQDGRRSLGRRELQHTSVLNHLPQQQLQNRMEPS